MRYIFCYWYCALFFLAFGLGIATGSYVGQIKDWSLLKALQSCGYHRHPVSDIGFLAARRGQVPWASALAVSTMVNSDNLEFQDNYLIGDCRDGKS
jgi:hypothetical protein